MTPTARGAFARFFRPNKDRLAGGVLLLVVALAFGVLHHDRYQGGWAILWILWVLSALWEIFVGLRARRPRDDEPQ